MSGICYKLLLWICNCLVKPRRKDGPGCTTLWNTVSWNSSSMPRHSKDMMKHFYFLEFGCDLISQTPFKTTTKCSFPSHPSSPLFILCKWLPLWTEWTHEITWNHKMPMSDCRGDLCAHLNRLRSSCSVSPWEALNYYCQMLAPQWVASEWLSWCGVLHKNTPTLSATQCLFSKWQCFKVGMSFHTELELCPCSILASFPPTIVLFRVSCSCDFLHTFKGKVLLNSTV